MTISLNRSFTGFDQRLSLDLYPSGLKRFPSRRAVEAAFWTGKASLEREKLSGYA
jgi:hypothetical protein